LGDRCAIISVTTSGVTSGESRSRAMECGIDDFDAKPYKISDVVKSWHTEPDKNTGSNPMHYEGTTYRPPPEADSLLLQITVGCTHNRCTFCSMYRDVSFRRSSMAEIKADIEEARHIYPRAERVFLVNGDAFALNADRLVTIARLIRQTFPECRTIATYASIGNIRSKSDRELALLRGHGINDLYVGVETGWDRYLERIDKGHTLEEARQHLQRLNLAGIRHNASLMLGVAGNGNGEENARRTAAFLNEVCPSLVWAGTMTLFEGAPLYEEMTRGLFTPAKGREILEEEKVLIRHLELEGVPFWGNHPTNIVPLMGLLPRDRQKMSDAIDAALERFDDDRLLTVLDPASL